MATQCHICKGDVPDQKAVPAASGAGFEAAPMEPRRLIDDHPLCSADCARTYQLGTLVHDFLSFMARVEFASYTVPDEKPWPR